jgi:hypothetical protein
VILRLDPKTEKIESFPRPDSYASVRQLAGRKGKVWGAESAADKLFMIKSESPVPADRRFESALLQRQSANPSVPPLSQAASAAAATVAMLSENRFTLGLGAGERLNASRRAPADVDARLDCM